MFLLIRTLLLLLLLCLLELASGFVKNKYRHSCRRHPATTTAAAATTTTTLWYKVLGAPAEGSYKPSVIEEGTNKVVTGNLNGSSRFFPRRNQEQRLVDDNYSTRNDNNNNNNVNDNGVASAYTQQQQQGGGGVYSSQMQQQQTTTSSNNDIHVEELRHWDGSLELAVQRQQPDGSLCVGGTPWEAGTAMADFLTNPDSGMNDASSWQDSFVIELGCGIGSCAIVAAMMGARRVVATDGDPTACRLTQQNAAKYAEYCNYPVQVAQLVWGDVDAAYQVCQGEYPNFILLADVVYAGADVPALRTTLQALCGPETWICWAHTWRDADQEQYMLDSFLDAWERFDMDVALLPPAFQTYRPDGRTPVSIFMYRARQ